MKYHEIETIIENLEHDLKNTNNVAGTNFILTSENIFLSPIELVDKEKGEILVFSFPRDVFNFLRGVRYLSNINK